MTIAAIIYALIYLSLIRFVYKRKGLKAVLLFVIALPIFLSSSVFFFKTFPLAIPILITIFFVLTHLAYKKPSNPSSETKDISPAPDRSDIVYTSTKGSYTDEEGNYFYKEVKHYLDHDEVVLTPALLNKSQRVITHTIPKERDDLSPS